MGPVLEDGPEVDLELEEAVDVPGGPPEVEDEQANAPEHGEDVGHGVDVAVVLVELQEVQDQHQPQRNEEEQGQPQVQPQEEVARV